MWQVLLAAAAAAAGSGILAKKLIKPISDFNTNAPQNDEIAHLHPKDSIFMFSSHKTEVKKNVGAKGEKKKGGKEKVVKNGSGKRVSVCLKKRRTGKNSAAKCDSCASKDNTFGWGVGVGLMYMMSAGKAEMSKLNCAVDETAKIVQELKSEISKRKSLSDEHASVAQNTEKSHCNDQVIACVPSSTGTVESASSAITMEEQQPEVLEMDQLEAELESELQKLPIFITESSFSEERTYMRDAGGSDMYQCNGVLPTELDNKLCHVLIGQQESQIEELEAELHHAHSKLNEREAELRALKDCVKRLTQFSLASASDEEMEDHNDDLQTKNEMKEKLGFDSTNSMVGMKRTLCRESYTCSAN